MKRSRWLVALLIASASLVVHAQGAAPGAPLPPRPHGWSDEAGERHARAAQTTRARFAARRGQHVLFGSIAGPLVSVPDVRSATAEELGVDPTAVMRLEVGDVVQVAGGRAVVYDVRPCESAIDGIVPVLVRARGALALAVPTGQRRGRVETQACSPCRPGGARPRYPRDVRLYVLPDGPWSGVAPVPLNDARPEIGWGRCERLP